MAQMKRKEMIESMDMPKSGANEPEMELSIADLDLGEEEAEMSPEAEAEMDLSAASDEALIAEIKKRGLADDMEMEAGKEAPAPEKKMEY